MQFVPDSPFKVTTTTTTTFQTYKCRGVPFVPATGKSRGGVRRALGELGKELTDAPSTKEAGGGASGACICK